MSNLLSNRLIAYIVLPVLLTGVALITTQYVPGVQQHSFFSFFLGGVAVAALLSGWQSALVTAALSILANAVVLEPRNSLLINDREDVIRLAAFSFTSILISVLSATSYRYRRALSGAEASLKHKEDELDFLKKTGSVWSWDYSLDTKRVRMSNIFNSQLIGHEQGLDVWLGTVDPADRVLVESAIQRGLKEGEFEAHYRVRMKGSMPRRVISRAVAYSVNGRLAGLRGIAMNVEHEST